MDASGQLILLGGLLLSLSVFAGLISARVGAPLLLAFLALGMLAGEEGPGHLLFGDFRAAYLIGSVALAIILFDGGIATHWASVKKLAVPSAVLATIGVVVTGGIVGIAAHYGFSIPWAESLLMGAVVAPTDAAAVASLLHLQGLRLRTRVAAVLEIESGLNDPMAVFITVLLVEIVSGAETMELSGGIQMFLLQMVGGAVIGVLGGRLLLFLFRRLTLNAGLYPILGLAGALTVFGGAQIVGASGFLATYLAAVILGNGRYSGKQAVDRFFGSLAWLSQIVLFLMLGLLVTPSSLEPILGSAFGVAFVLILVARPVAVAVCLVPFRFKWREVLFVSWVGLRGAVPIFLAIIPVLAGAPGGFLLFGTAFIVVMVSLIIQGWTVAPLARWLGLDLPNEAPTAHLDIDLPETLGAKSGGILGYRVDPNSAAAGHRLSELPIPPGTDVLLTIREGVAYGRDMTMPLAPDDYVLVWGNQKDVPLLDGMLGPRSDRTGADPSGGFGEFAFAGTTALSAILALYDEKPRRNADATLADYMKARIGKPSIGDRVRVGAIELIIREMTEDEEIASVAVEVDPSGARSSFKGLLRRLKPSL